MLDFIHYKGGVRIHALCGSWAMKDYRRRYTNVATMASAMSVKQEDVILGFHRLREEIEDKKKAIATLRARYEQLLVDSIPETDGSLCLFESDMDALSMRNLLNVAVKKCGRICGVFVGNDEIGYRYVMGRGTPDIDLKSQIKVINAALSARGGGSSDMLQGSSCATRDTIEAYFQTL